MITRRKLLAALPIVAAVSIVGHTTAERADANEIERERNRLAENYRESIASNFNGYYDEFGHHFQFEYLAQHNREWTDVLYKCYPFLAWHKLGNEYDYAAIYDVHHYPKKVVYQMGSENFDDHLRHNLRQFQSGVYGVTDWFGFKKNYEVVKLSDQPHDWLYSQVGMFYATY